MNKLTPPGHAGREEILALSVDLLGVLLRAPADQLDAAIGQTLGRLGSFCGVDRCHAARVTHTENGVEISMIGQWSADHVSAAGVSPDALRELWDDAWQAGTGFDRLVRIDNVCALPDSAPEKAPLLQRGVRSLLALPIRSDGALSGMVCIDVLRHERAYHRSEVQLLESVADAIGAALARADATCRITAARQSIAEAHDRLKTTLGALQELVIEVDADGRYLEVHTGDPGQMMVPADRLIGRTHEDVMPPDIAALNRRAMAEVDATGRSGPHPFWADTPRGRRRYALTATPRPPHRPGAAPGYVFVSRDITLEWHLTREAERLGLIARRMTDLVMVIGMDDRIEWVNPAFEARTGWTLEEVRGRKPGEILHCAGTDRAELARIKAAMNDGQAVAAELLNRTRDGEEFWTDIDIQPLHDDTGRLTGFVSIETDITERKAQAAALERLAHEADQARARLETAVEALPDFFALFDSEERLVLCNSHIRAFHPKAAGALQPGMRFEDLLRAAVAADEVPEARGREEDWIAQRLAEFRCGDSSVEREVSGRWMRLIERATPDGGRVGMAIDIAEIKDAERRLEEIIDAAAAGTWELDLEIGSKRVNDRWAQMLGYTRDELAARQHHGFRDLIHPDDLATLMVQHDTLLATGHDRFANEIRMRHKNGHWVWLLSRGQVIARDSTGQPKKLAGIHLDITERVRLESQLMEERDYLARLMDTSASGITALDGHGRIIFVNREAEGILGLDAAAIEARPFDDPAWQIRALDGGPLPREALPYPRVMADGQTVRDARFAICWPDGKQRILSVNAAPFTAEGLAVRVVCSITDITEQVAAETALRSAAERAEAANRAKSRFLANMSHEIRTPLNGVLGMAQVLETELSEPHHREMLSTIRASGETLLGILNDVLDMSKIEAGKLTLETMPFVPADLARRIEAMHALQAARKGLSFELACSDGARLPRLGDPGRLAQVLHNLIGNAIKFTERGGVAVSLEGDAESALSLVVRDTGIGMTSEQLARVFDDFEQADGTVTRRFGGTGLGMSIVSRLVALMHGDIAVDSTPGRGTIMRVRLPLPVAARVGAAEPAVVTRSIARLRVLAADDNRTNRTILRSMLVGLGAQVVLAADGRAAVDTWHPGRFDLYLLDISMPELDGIGALRCLRQREAAAGARPAPAIAVTANVMSHQVAEYLRSGFCGYIAKPFRRDELARALADALHEAD